MEFIIMTKDKYDVIDITDKVEKEINIDDGLCIVYVPHATAGLIVNEFEPNIAQDYVTLFKTLLPKNDWRHDKIDDNAEAHLLSSLFGTSKTFIVKDGKLVLGTWQRIILCEFDGPRNRRVVVKVLG
ncbi:YjbQ family protein [Candidatus Micrarchaeota archaeon]|nr:YjbQ family protein [Candidatus Micrarchaeota archaeon]